MGGEKQTTNNFNISNSKGVRTIKKTILLINRKAGNNMTKFKKIVFICLAVMGIATVFNNPEKASAYTYSQGGMTVVLTAGQSNTVVNWNTKLNGQPCYIVGMLDYQYNGSVVGESYISGSGGTVNLPYLKNVPRGARIRVRLSGAGSSSSGFGIVRTAMYGMSMLYRSSGGTTPIQSLVDITEQQNVEIDEIIYDNEGVLVNE